ncbi:11564_t:CDS:2 [Ambispora gerdemannii]|uniref:11564_t:CDS:1 n=1 Tax=Ambispora gerdemannii TaxID=144530 RepID=A0A9N8YN91_9GLOM|nr:11564_t:CDS:2 [Ambispora gerdemannii]
MNQQNQQQNQQNQPQNQPNQPQNQQNQLLQQQQAQIINGSFNIYDEPRTHLENDVLTILSESYHMISDANY